MRGQGAAQMTVQGLLESIGEKYQTTVATSVHHFLEEQFHFLEGRVSGGVGVKMYPRVGPLGRPMPRVAMQRAPRMQFPGGTNLLYLF